MGFKHVKVYSNSSILFYIKCALFLSCVYNTYGWSSQSMEYETNIPLNPGRNAPNIVMMGDSTDLTRHRRDTALPDRQVAAATVPPTASTNATVTSTSPVPGSNVTNATSTTIASNVTVADTTGQNNTDDNYKTTKLTPESTTSAPSTPSVTKTPLLGPNVSDHYHGSASKTPKVSEPIVPDDDNISVEVFMAETPERIKAEHNLTNLKYDNHTYYNSVFIGNISFFNSHWANITNSTPEIHNVLSNSHRRATNLKLPFKFPFYGFPISEVTVATGGFIYTGDHVHNWLAATQYIAPLMANFDTTYGNESLVKLYKDDEKFTALWENVTLQEDTKKPFTFAVTLYKNGNIIFAYKDMPLPVHVINETEHPVKIGISDAYLTDRIALHVRTKTIYEYDRVSFKPYDITNNTILKLIALPTCLQYNSCEECVNHNTTFKCGWCTEINKCSSGTDRRKQDWVLRHCDKLHVLDESFCSVNSSSTFSPRIKALQEPNVSSAIGGVVAVFIIVTLISSLAAWVLYAFKNPHTRSGQLLIKYRPSQWSWRRGEARYTAATIHM